MRSAHDRAFADRRMAQQHFLYLARINVGAAGDDHVLRAVPDGEEAFRVQAADIAGVQPAAALGLGGSFRVLPVALHYAVRARDDLADLARRQLLVLVVEDLHLDPGARVAAGFEVLLEAVELLRQTGDRHRRFALP